MKKTFIAMFVLLALQLPLMGQMEMDYSLGVNTNYIFRGHDYGVSPMIAPAFELKHESGVSLELLGIFGSDFKEIEATVAYPLKINKDLSVDAGLIYYWDDFDFANSDLEVFGRFDYSALPMPLKVLTAYNLNESGLYIEPATEMEQKVGDFPIMLTAAAGLEFNEYVKTLTHVRVDAATEFEAGPVVLKPYINLYLILSDKINSETFAPNIGVNISLP